MMFTNDCMMFTNDCMMCTDAGKFILTSLELYYVKFHGMVSSVMFIDGVKAKNLGNIQRYTSITLYPTLPLYTIIIIFDTVLRQKGNLEHEK